MASADKDMGYRVVEGQQAPEFRAASSTGGEVGLQDFRGKKNVVLYFYPKDDTPGCTKEACAFRDLRGDFEALDTVVLGVSKDGLPSHGRFQEKYGLTFPLLSDPDRRIIEAYDVWREKTMYGKPTLGVERATFLIDREGTIRRAWRKVKVDGHVEEVLAAAKAL